MRRASMQARQAGISLLVLALLLGADRATAQNDAGAPPAPPVPTPAPSDPPDSPAAGAEAAGEEYLPPPQDAVGARLVNLPTPFTFGRRGIDVLFTHRFSETIQDGSERDLFGLDSAADTGIGITFGVARRLDLELYRTSVQETYELAAKGMLLTTSGRLPVSIALRAGADLVHASGVADSERPFAQALLGIRFGSGWNFFAAPGYVRGTPRLRNAWNVPFGLTLPLRRYGLLEIEVVPANRDLPAGEAAWHVAFSKSAGTHIFELTLGNSRATTVDQMLAGDFVGGFEGDDVRLGFNLVRGFEF